MLDSKWQREVCHVTTLVDGLTGRTSVDWRSKEVGYARLVGFGDIRMGMGCGQQSGPSTGCFEPAHDFLGKPFLLDKFLHDHTDLFFTLEGLCQRLCRRRAPQGETDSAAFRLLGRIENSTFARANIAMRLRR